MRCPLRVFIEPSIVTRFPEQTPLLIAAPGGLQVSTISQLCQPGLLPGQAFVTQELCRLYVCLSVRVRKEEGT